MEGRFSKGIDWPVILILLLIMSFGVLNIYSVDPSYGIKQIVRIGLGFGLVLVGLIVSSLVRNFFDIYANIFYLLGILALIGVLFLGVEVNGAKAWYRFGGVSIQPVELMKIATALMISHVLNFPGTTLKNPKTFLTCLGLLGLPALLIVLQPDVGSLFVFAAFFLALYREGMHPSFLLLPLAFGGIFLSSIAWNTPNVMVVLSGLGWLLLSLLLFLKKKAKTKAFLSFLLGGYLGIAFFSGGFLYWILPKHELSLGSYFLAPYRFSLVGLLGLFILLNLLCSLRIFWFLLRKPSFTESQAKIKSPQLLLGLGGLVSLYSLCFLLCSGAQKILESLPKHQRERVLVLFEGEMKYRDTSGYNLLYAKTAIGSGEFWGAGWNKGPVTDGHFVPEQWTDYIFCTVGEEWGFVGCSLLVLAYTLLIGRIYYLAEKQKNVFGRFFGYSIGTILLLHFFMNMGMVMGLFPTVGIPLPFMSYGGSSLWGFTLMIFIFLKINYEGKQSLL